MYNYNADDDEPLNHDHDDDVVLATRWLTLTPLPIVNRTPSSAIKAKNSLMICATQAAIILMAISTSTAVESTGIRMPSFATPTSLPNYYSFRISRSKLIVDPTMPSGTSIGLSYCAEASSNCASHAISIRRIEQQENTVGFDVKSARGWMEHIEENEGQMYGVGAYTVLRCDAIYTKQKCRWKIWGKDFHIHRLCSSFRSLMENENSESFNENIGFEWKRTSIQRTDYIIGALLGDAEMYLLNVKSTEESQPFELEVDKGIRTLMLTVLWTPTIMNGKSNKIHGEKSMIIRAHAAFASSSHVRNGAESLPTPISVCLAIPRIPSPEALSILPRRHSGDRGCRASSTQLIGPHAKVSSWCRNRRPLEDSFKDGDVGEVLLMGLGKDISNVGGQGFINSLEILEGLISNLFVIYKDGTVRTAPASKVLSGYARHLVSEEIHQTHGLRLDDKNAPIVGDADDWSEIFVTSSVRLIVPVKRVLIPPVGSRDSMTLWECSGSDVHHQTELLWSGILKK